MASKHSVGEYVAALGVYFSSRAFRGFWAETREGLEEDFVAFFEARHPALNEN